MNRPQIVTVNNPIGIAMVTATAPDNMEHSHWFRLCSKGFERLCTPCDHSNQMAENNPEESQVPEPLTQVTVRDTEAPSQACSHREGDSTRLPAPGTQREAMLPAACCAS